MFVELCALRPKAATDGGTDNVTTQILDMAHPITDATLEGAFTHVFSTMALQIIQAPEVGTMQEWKRLLAPDGVVAIGIWDFDAACDLARRSARRGSELCKPAFSTSEELVRLEPAGTRPKTVRV